MSIPASTGVVWQLTPLKGGNQMAIATFRSTSTGVLAAPGTAVATTASKAKFTNPTQYLIGGTSYNKAATDNFWTLTTAANLAVSEGIIVLLCVNAAGAASVVYGVVAAAGAEVAPADPTDRAVFAELKIETDGVTTFTGGTTALNAAGVTSTFTDRDATSFSEADQVSEMMPLYDLPLDQVHIYGDFGAGSVSLKGFNVDAAAATPQAIHRTVSTTSTFSTISSELMSGILETPQFIQASSTGNIVNVVIAVLMVDRKVKG